MNKNDIKMAVDEIKPDPYLKERLSTKISATAVPKKRHLGVKAGVAVALCFAVIGTSIGVFSNKNEVELVPQTQSSSEYCVAAPGFAMIAYAKENGEKVTEHFLATKTPLKYNITVTDIRGKSEKEIEKLMKSSTEKIDSVELPEDVASAQQGTERLDNILLTRTEYNYFDLDLPADIVDSIKEIRVANTSKYGEIVVECPDVFYTENGEYIYECHDGDTIKDINIMDGFLCGNNILLKGERYEKIKRLNLNFGIYWQPAQEMYYLLDKEQNAGFSKIKDTLTFEVEFKDGSLSKSVLEISFDENGNMFATTKSFDHK